MGNCRAALETFYEWGSQGNIPLLTGSRAFSLGFQPLQVAAIVPCSAAVDDGASRESSSSSSRILYASWRSREQRASVPETGQAVSGRNTATTVLFETQGLMLFSVVRGGTE